MSYHVSYRQAKMDSLIKNNRVLLVIHGSRQPDNVCYNMSYIVNWSKVINDPIPIYAKEKLDKLNNAVLDQYVESDNNPYLSVLRYRFYEEAEDTKELLGKFDRIDLVAEDCVTPVDPSTWWDLDDHTFFEPHGLTTEISSIGKFRSEIKAVINDHGKVVMGDASEFGELEWFNAW